MSKRYQKKSATKKKRNKSGHGPSRNAVGGQTTGVMGGMVHGFRRAVGSEEDKGSSKGSSLLWTAVLVTVTLAVVAWNFAQ
ncbi:MAG: hypothetical protein AAF436_01035 [Myxococcota bacterium]